MCVHSVNVIHLVALYRHRVNIWVRIQFMLYILPHYTDTGSTYGCAFSLCYTSCHIIQTQGQHMGAHSVYVIYLVTLYRHRVNIWMRIQFMLYILSHYTDTGSTYGWAFSLCYTSCHIIQTQGQHRGVH